VSVEVLVVQHGEKVRSSAHPGLTELGHRQAAAVAGWLAGNRTDIDAIVASPLRRAQETASPIADALGLELTTEPRFTERMNWGDDAGIEFDAFLIEWERTTQDRTYQPATGDSSNNAAARFIDALVDFELDDVGVVVVVAHGGVTVDTLRTIVGDRSVINANADLLSRGVPSCAITRLRVDNGVVTTIDYPSTKHLDRHLRIDQAPADK
jgi:probable phosphoglycerate mutase